MIINRNRDTMDAILQSNHEYQIIDIKDFVTLINYELRHSGQCVLLNR